VVRNQAFLKIRDRLLIVVAVTGLAMMAFGTCVTIREVHAKRAAQAAKVERLRGAVVSLKTDRAQLERELRACEVSLARACEGLQSCDWADRQGKVVFDARDVGRWTDAMREQEAGLRACHQSQPEGVGR
jgi:outer membrane murein-binding lipoprotein Lpp